MQDFLRSHTWGGVPEGIIVLIDDVAGSRGTLRSSAVRCYVRSGDIALLSQAVAAVAGLGGVGARVGAPNVPSSQILEELRSLGCSPAAEDEAHITTPARPSPPHLPAPTPTKKQSRSLAQDEHVERAVAHLISTMHAHQDAPVETIEQQTA